jgi:hypothetical protein
MTVNGVFDTQSRSQSGETLADRFSHEAKKRNIGWKILLEDQLTPDIRAILLKSHTRLMTIS